MKGFFFFFIYFQFYHTKIFANFPPIKFIKKKTFIIQTLFKLALENNIFQKKFPNFWVKKATRFVKENNWSLSTSNGGKIANTYHIERS